MPVRSSAEADGGIKLEQHVGAGQGETAAVEAVEGPGGAGDQERAAVGVADADGVGQRGDPVAIDNDRASVTGGVDLVVLEQPVVLMPGVVVNRRVLLDRDEHGVPLANPPRPSTSIHSAVAGIDSCAGELIVSDI